MSLLNFLIGILYHQLGFFRDVEVLCGKIKYPTDFLVPGSTQYDYCPIIFGRPFLNTVNAKIDCNKDNVSVGLGDMSHELVDNPVMRNCLVKMKLLVLLILSCLLLILWKNIC